jgi:lysyl-tRNA synthetase class I
MLLTTAEMPGLNERTTWTEESTEEQGLQADGSDPVGACQLTPLHDIGATEAVQRTFTAQEGDATATQVIATLADAKSLRQTHEVLRSWHDKCEETIEAAVTEVGPLEEVPVENGEGEAYVMHYGEQGATTHTWESVAINVSGDLISLVVITSRAQDYDYEQTPAEQATVAVGAKLG